MRVTCGCPTRRPKHRPTCSRGSRSPCSSPVTTRRRRSRAVVRDFRAALPQARIAVFDNASRTRRSRQRATPAPKFSPSAARGKGNVVRRMFADIYADIYLMADGDGTYDASAAPQLVAMILDDQVDMAIGARAECAGAGASRRPCARQPAVQPPLRRAVRLRLRRHLFRLSRLLTPLRQKLPGALVGIRDRDGIVRPCDASCACRSAKSFCPMASARKARPRS